MGFDLYLLKRQRAIGAAKAEIVFQRDFKLHITRGVGAVIQIALGVLIEDVDGGRYFLMVQCQDGEHGLYPASGTQQMPRHGFGRADDDFFRMLAQCLFDGVGFIDVTQRRGGAVGVDVVDLIHVEACIA